MRIQSILIRSCAAAAMVIFLTACESPQQRMQSHYERGLKFVADGDPVRANLEFRNALTLNNDFVPALYELAKIEESNRKFQQAAGIFLRIVEQDDQHVGARVGLARILLFAGRLDDALKYADQAFALAEGELSVLTLKATLALKLSDPKSAVQFAEKALDVEPENPEALMVLAAERFADNDPNGALAFVERGIARDSDNLGLQLFRMRVLESLGDQKGIEAVFLKLVSLMPDNLTINNGLVQWYLSKNQPEDAEQAMRNFVSKNSENSEAGLQLIRFLKSTKGDAVAISELQSLIDGAKNAFTYRIAMADLLFQQGNRDEAIAHLNRLIEDAANVADRSTARIRLDCTILSEVDGADVPEEAKSVIKSVLQDDARNVDALLLEARIAVAEERLEDAIETIRLAMDEQPDSTQIRLMLADAYQRTGAAALAEEQLAKAVQIDREDPGVRLAYAQFLIRFGKFDQAERVLAEMPLPNKDVLGQLAQLRLREGDWSGAQEVADQLQKLGESGGVSEQIRAAALRGQSKFQESLEVLENYASKSSGGPEPIVSLVRTYVAAGQTDRADALLDKLIEANANNVDALILKGAVSAHRGDAKAAEANYRKAMDASSESVAGHAALSALFLQDKRYEDAERVARAALERQPQNAALRLFLGTVLEQAGKYEPAIAEYEIMLKADPRSTIAANNLASLISEHRTDKASLERAFEIAGRFKGSEIPQFLDTLGWIHHLRGDHGEAVTLLKRAAEQLPDFGPVHYHLGMAYLGLERQELARDSLEKAVALSTEANLPYSVAAKKALADMSLAAEQNGTN